MDAKLFLVRSSGGGADQMHDYLVSRARSLRYAALALEVIAIAGCLGGILAGGAIAGHVRMLDDEKTYPYLAAGLAVVIAAVLLGALTWCLGRAIGLFATDIAARQGVDITEREPSRLPEFLQR